MDVPSTPAGHSIAPDGACVAASVAACVAASVAAVVGASVAAWVAGADVAGADVAAGVVAPPHAVSSKLNTIIIGRTYRVIRFIFSPLELINLKLSTGTLFDIHKGTIVSTISMNLQ
jgi:hypothetical protein